MTRLLCLKTADMMDKAGNKAAQLEITAINGHRGPLLRRRHLRLHC
jgi:hypothetical protein